MKAVSVKTMRQATHFSLYCWLLVTRCCGATVGSEQQHNQDLREIYKVGRILEFITFYQNALHLTRVHWDPFYQNVLRHEQLT